MTNPTAVASAAPTSEPDPRRQPPPGAEERRRVGAEPEERGVAERDLAGVAAGDVPGRRRRAPQQDEDQPVEEEGVAHDDRDERGDARRRATAGHDAPSRADRLGAALAEQAGGTDDEDRDEQEQVEALPSTPCRSRRSPTTSTAATMRLAISAPAMSPSPPSTTAT